MVPLMLTVGTRLALELAVGVVPSSVTVVEALDTVEIDCEYAADTPRAIWPSTEAFILLLKSEFLLNRLGLTNDFQGMDGTVSELHFCLWEKLSKPFIYRLFRLVANERMLQ
jgi:hypothetical protein